MKSVTHFLRNYNIIFIRDNYYNKKYNHREVYCEANDNWKREKLVSWKLS